eukprot:scaffold243379_cov39-Prasinocladus_malaysianus.AAC.2
MSDGPGSAPGRHQNVANISGSKLRIGLATAVNCPEPLLSLPYEYVNKGNYRVLMMTLRWQD